MVTKGFLFMTLIIGLSACGVYLEYPQPGNNIQWKLVKHNDTLVYRLRKDEQSIDSVYFSENKRIVKVPDKRNYFTMPAADLKPGINELALVFYVNGKKRHSTERIYMVSELTPKQHKVENYYLLDHDEKAFTQGLLWWNKHLYESTGLVGESSLRIINPQTGDIVQKQCLDDKIFAEGICIKGGQLHLLTWKDGLLYTFNDQLTELSMHPYKEEGWGLCLYNSRLVSSNGTNKLYYLNNRYQASLAVEVFNHRGPVAYLNELETIDNYIWANVLGSDSIVVIDPETGKVMQEIDVSACINRHQYPNAGVLNGIAYDETTKTVYLTGKNWPFIIVWRPIFF